MRRYVEKPCLGCGNERKMRVDRQICQVCVHKAARVKAKETMRRLRASRAKVLPFKRVRESEAMTGVKYE